MLRRVQVEHELAERALHARELALQHHEARAGQFCRRLEIHEAHGLAQLVVLLGEIGPLRLAPFALLAVGLLVGPDGHVVERQVGDFGERLLQRLARLLLRRLRLGHGVLQRRDLGHQRLGARLVLLRLGLADLLGGGVAAGLHVLQRGDGGAARLVEPMSRAAAGSAPRFVSARSSASGLSRIQRMSSMSNVPFGPVERDGSGAAMR